MEHPILQSLYVPSSKDINLDLYRYYVRKSIDETNVWSMLSPSPQWMREQKISNAGSFFQGNVSEAVHSLDAIRRHMKGNARDSLAPHIRNLLLDLDGLLSYAYQKKVLGLERHEMEHEHYLFLTLFEQVPDPGNRVVLSRERDALNMPRSELHLKLTDYDRKSYLTILDLFAREFGAEGYGRLGLNFEPAEKEWPVTFWDHQMGTTRMHESPKRGIVDPQSRVHGIRNLYVAGSSVFPTGGFAPPTLTLTALAVRLSDHLKEVLARGTSSQYIAA